MATIRRRLDVAQRKREPRADVGDQPVCRGKDSSTPTSPENPENNIKRAEDAEEPSALELRVAAFDEGHHRLGGVLGRQVHGLRLGLGFQGLGQGHLGALVEQALGDAQGERWPGGQAGGQVRPRWHPGRNGDDPVDQPDALGLRGGDDVGQQGQLLGLGGRPSGAGSTTRHRRC